MKIKELKFDKWTILMILIMIMVISGVFGFIYETIFYRIDLGKFVKRGTTFGPWIPIYGFGGLLITLFTYKYRKKPFMVFILSTFICGSLEFITGYLLFHISGTRLWDYNTEILNFLNIGGYVCLRSVLFFGISGVFLVNTIIPLCNRLATKVSKLTFTLISLIPGILFLLDFIISDILKS